MDITTHRPEYVKLARQYVDDAKAVLAAMSRDFWTRPGLAILRTVQTPSRHPQRTERAGWDLTDYADDEGQSDGASWCIGRSLVDIGECCLPGGYTTADALVRLKEHMVEMADIKKELKI